MPKGIEKLHNLEVLKGLVIGRIMFKLFSTGLVNCDAVNELTSAQDIISIFICQVISEDTCIDFGDSESQVGVIGGVGFVKREISN
ncbi:hypothetical protein CR513_35596, partial [Mucuna pruriens]